jgi:hypothetical protein
LASRTRQDEPSSAETLTTRPSIGSANLIEQMFAHLKDFRHIAARYDKLVKNFLVGALIAATIVWWLN